MPKGFRALSNGVLLNQKDEGGKTLFHWKMDHPHSIYLITLAAGRFAEVQDNWENVPCNYYVEHGAITRDQSGKYTIDFEKMPGQIETLAKELLEMEATGDRAKAEAWFKKYDVIPPELQASLDKAKTVPVDVDPLFAFPRKVQ